MDFQIHWPIASCWNAIPGLCPQKRRVSEISCSMNEQERSKILACESSNDVIVIKSKENNDDHDQSSSSYSHLHKSKDHKLINRIFPPIVDSSGD
ncbi:hypothetical protein PGTUg99_017728 [Puccinia graminis f. sp. tritici]|uniref:Uncharacterized protein n=1 Tax=Puccinia graminis f. sp. tritici TaxID=56615 RepID=A0A5B0LX13_PUCGR|nr:hypothetical protein PGTUg99_017728 [Puccinia graminis f. sp. tritici]